MTTTDPPWEPPLAATEVEHLLGALDRLRTTFRWKADGLDEEGLRATTGTTSLTLGSLLKHLALVEVHSARAKLAGASLGPPWDAVDWETEPDWDFRSAAHDAAEGLYALFDGAVAMARDAYWAAIGDGGLDRLVHVCDDVGRHASLRRLLFDLVEEYGRHTGHADLLREAVDGRVGEDPPPGWTAVSGSYPMPSARRVR